MVPGDFKYKSSTIPKIRASSISGMICTRIICRSDLLTEGMNWIRVKSSMINGKKASIRKKDAWAAYTVISSFPYFWKIRMQFNVKRIMGVPRFWGFSYIVTRTGEIGKEGIGKSLVTKIVIVVYCEHL
jgi:hypothetical protein